MTDLENEAKSYAANREKAAGNAGQLAAFQLSCGLDLGRVLESGPDLASKCAIRVRRLIERERLRGTRRHWSYDLNRHIALKQVLDRLLAATGNG